jgi:hypothetical protein
MISPSTRDASTAAVEEVVTCGASTSSVEARTGLGDDVERSSGFFYHCQCPVVPDLQRCSPPFPCHLHTQRQCEDKEQSHRISHDMTQQ